MTEPRPRRPSIHTSSQIGERIWLAIADRRLRPGTRLKEEELAEIFQASRARVRQALSSLERDGLVTIFPHRGACVSAPTVEDARDVFYARRAIEGRVMERLVPTVEPTHIAALRAHVEQERRAGAADDTASLIRLSGGFHLALADLVGSDFLSSTMRDLIARTSLITAVYRDTAQFDCGPHEHGAIVDRLEAGDAESAAALMIEHLNHIESELKLDERLSAEPDLRAALL